MRERLLSLLLLFSCAKLGWLIYQRTSGYLGESLPLRMRAPKPASNVEQQFALRRRVSFLLVDMYDLELIPGVSDTLAQNILDARDKILNYSRSKPALKVENPFMLAHGVGKSTAQKLSLYLEIP